MAVFVQLSKKMSKFGDQLGQCEWTSKICNDTGTEDADADA